MILEGEFYHVNKARSGLELDRAGLERSGITSHADQLRELEHTYHWLSRDMKFVRAVADRLEIEGRLGGSHVWQIVHAGFA